MSQRHRRLADQCFDDGATVQRTIAILLADEVSKRSLHSIKLLDSLLQLVKPALSDRSHRLSPADTIIEREQLFDFFQ